MRGKSHPSGRPCNHILSERIVKVKKKVLTGVPDVKILIFQVREARTARGAASRCSCEAPVTWHSTAASETQFVVDS